MVILLANGAAVVTATGDDVRRFTAALTEVCVELAKAIVSDGEGATKVFEVRVGGARSVDEARAAARTIASSNLVKAAIHGADPNWGRILAAAGRSGANIQDRKATVRIGGHAVFEEGAPSAYDSQTVRAVLRQAEILIELDLGLGEASARAWGCDLSAEYVRVNADYTS
jgi:glutamate N-acetyltransferase/amino-acid N-acetyltransferase